MKHEILEEVWRVRDQIAAECGHNLKKFAAVLRQEEAKYGARIVHTPVRRRRVRKATAALQRQRS